MKIDIKSRWTGSVLFSLECNSWRIALEGAVLQGADLQGAYLKGAYLKGAHLQGADLQGAYLQGADLQGAYLKGAYLKGAHLQGAYLQGAYLKGAYLKGAHLQGAYLQGADLQGVYLKGAYLKGAHLQGADLQGVYLKGANNISPDRVTPLRMLYDQPGKIRAYKIVKENGEGIYRGGIVFKKGGTYKVNKVNADEQERCGAGINLATLDWCMSEWEPSYKILVAEFTAKDIVAIPVATDGKFRVRRCKIVAEKDLKKLGLVKS